MIESWNSQISGVSQGLILKWDVAEVRLLVVLLVSCSFSELKSPFI